MGGVGGWVGGGAGGRIELFLSPVMRGFSLIKGQGGVRRQEYKTPLSRESSSSAGWRIEEVAFQAICCD